MWKDRNIEKFKIFIHIVYTSIEIGILDSCLSDSYFCFFNFFPLEGLEKGDKASYKTLNSFLSVQFIPE